MCRYVRPLNRMFRKIHRCCIAWSISRKWSERIWSREFLESLALVSLLFTVQTLQLILSVINKHKLHTIQTDTNTKIRFHCPKTVRSFLFCAHVYTELYKSYHDSFCPVFQREFLIHRVFIPDSVLSFLLAFNSFSQSYKPLKLPEVTRFTLK